jgi:hypothetical protein
MNQGHDENKRQEGQDGGRRGEAGRLGGAAKDGHLSPQADVKGGKSEGGGQIAQDRQQSSGHGAGQA